MALGRVVGRIGQRERAQRRVAEGILDEVKEVQVREAPQLEDGEAVFADEHRDALPRLEVPPKGCRIRQCRSKEYCWRTTGG